MAAYCNTLKVESGPTSAGAALRIFAGEELKGLEKYLYDESRQTGRAEAVAFPTDIAQLSRSLKIARESSLPVTISGARTGIAGGAVPRGGMVISTERMNRFLGLRRATAGEMLLRCECGVLLSELRKAVSTGVFSERSGWDAGALELAEELQRGHWCFPPDPTETGATIGGMAACNASGAHTFLYGPMRPYVHGLTVVLADGDLLRLERGRVRADESGKMVLLRPDGRRQVIEMPSYSQPATKNAAGYFSDPNLDAVDLFIGSEGTLGIIAEVEVRLLPAPETSSAEIVFWPDEPSALAFVKALRTRRVELGVEAIEYFDPNAIEFIRRYRSEHGPASGVPHCLPEEARAGVYLDLGLDKSSVPEVLVQLQTMIVRLGGDPQLTWSAHANSEREMLRLFRHALPESVNARVAQLRQVYPQLTKLGTDMAVPDRRLDEIMSIYKRELSAAGLEYVIFGHIGDNHVHVNILPRNPADYMAGKRLYLELARKVVKMGGSPAAEHGIGKLKREFLKILVGEQGIDQMKAIKRSFDANFQLSPGNLFV